MKPLRALVFACSPLLVGALIFILLVTLTYWVSTW